MPGSRSRPTTPGAGNPVARRTSEYIVDGRDWTHAQAADAVRRLLVWAEPVADHYECDIPPDHADWTPEVVAAAEHLRSVAKRWDGGVAATGVRRFARDETWSAFVTFASEAYDATLWDGVGARGIISLADEAESIALRLTPEQLAETRMIRRSRSNGTENGSPLGSEQRPLRRPAKPRAARAVRPHTDSQTLRRRSTCRCRTTSSAWPRG